MSITYKHQEQFAAELTQAWLDGKREHVRTIIRNLKNKAQAAYIAARIAVTLAKDESVAAAYDFANFIHPNL